MRTTRGLRRRVWVLLSVGAVLSMTVRAQPRGETINPFHVVVNDTIAWQREFVEGYVHSPSVAQGEVVHFMVSTLAGYDTLTGTSVPKPCMMQIYRVTSRHRGGSGDTLMADGIGFSGSFYPLHDSLNQPTITTPFQPPQAYPYDYRYGCNWPVAVSYPIAETWPSGFYYARITVQGYAGSGVIPFVVRSAVPGSASKILCVIAWNTYQAYNYWGGGSLYWWTGTFSSPDTEQIGGGTQKVIHTVSFRRPFANFWSEGYPYTTQFGQLDHRERAFIAWAEENNYLIEYCVDADVNADADGIITGGHYSLIVVPGHSEYWSYDQRSTLERRTGSGFKRNGGHLAFLAANNCYWKVEYRPEFPPSRNPDSMFCNKNRNGSWWRKQGVEPTGAGGHEARLIGVEYMGNNGMRRVTGNDTIFHGADRKNRVREAGHWIFRRSGLREGSEFGGGVYGGDFYETSDALVSGESDMRVAGQSPSGTVLLADTLVRPLFSDVDPHYGEVADHILRAQMVLYEDTLTNSRVFAAGGFGWSTSLFGPDSLAMRFMHRSILDHLSGRKYIGNVYSRPPDYRLDWLSDIELDGDVSVLSGSTLRVSEAAVTIDSGVSWLVDGVVEITGAVAVRGKGGGPSSLVLRSGGTLVVKSGGSLTIAGGTTLTAETGATVTLEGNATVRIDSSAGAMVKGAATFAFGAGSRLEVNGVVHVADTVTLSLPSSSETRMLPGSTLSLGWGSVLSSSGKFEALGTSLAPVRFQSDRSNPQSSAYWQMLDVSGGPNLLRNCVIQDSQHGVYFNNTTSTLLLDSCTIRNGSAYAVQAFNTSMSPNSLLIRDCVIDSNMNGVTVQNGRIDIVQNSDQPGIRHNGYGIVAWTGGRVYAQNARITNNNDWGVYVNGSTAQVNFTPNGLAPGYNRLRDNADGQLWVQSGSAFLGSTNTICICDPIEPEEPTTPDRDEDAGAGGLGGSLEANCLPPCYVSPIVYGGFNHVSGDWSSYKYWIKTQSAGVAARKTYWGLPEICPPPPGAFSGTVDRTECLTVVGESLTLLPGSKKGEPQIESFIDSTSVIALLQVLKEDLLLGTANARRALHELASLCGRGGGFSRFLRMEWRQLLELGLTRNLPMEVKNILKAYRLQDMMDTRQYDEAIAYGNTLSGSPNDELWFHAQATLVHAFAASGRLAEASAQFNRMKARGADGNPQATDHLEYVLSLQSGGGTAERIPIGRSTVVADGETPPTGNALSHAYPNPFNPSTEIRFDLPEPSTVSLAVYDLLGRKVADLAAGDCEAGYHSASWNATGVASGVYLARFTATSATGNVAYTKTHKLLLMK